MRELLVDLPGRAYVISMEKGCLDAAGERVRRACPRAVRAALITDSTVGPLYASRVETSLREAGLQVRTLTVPAGEESKNAATLARLWEELAAFGLTRSDVVAALGGGVVGDLAGFAAATILRGVDFVQLPTTLLAQVDSSVGGKVAVDLDHGKNLAGAFHQPRLVLMDPDTLTTLDDRTFADGMAEVIKYGCIADRDFFAFLQARPTRAAVMEDIEHVLYICCDIKRRVVEEDERDTGRRMLLNFGHTVGHAYEKIGGYKTWTHGQAVAAGMCLAARLGADLGVSPAGLEGPISALCAAFGLPTFIDVREDQWPLVTETVGLDKKSAGEAISLILLEELGRARAVSMDRAAALRALAAIYGRA